MRYKTLLILFLILGILFFFNQSNVFAYDDKTTHPALTDEIVDFYNLSFPNNQLTPQQKEWVVEGSILEDTPPRWINHFYDPINKIGWSGEYAGVYDKETVQIVSENLIAPYGITPVSSLEWLHNEQLQAQYGFYKGAKTWERGILEMIKGNEEDGYKILGYILHLIEDASVPDHTRNDTHAHELEGVTGDYGSPYEEYLKRYTRQNIKKELNIAENLKKENLFPIQKQIINEYLISLAEYSNKYFFSKDTINDFKYQNPKIVRDDGNFGYGKDENGKEFILAKEVQNKIDKFNIINSFMLDDKSDVIIDVYFSHLSRQAVLHGAGVINFFLEEIKNNKEYPQHPIVYDFSIYNYFEVPRISFAGEYIRIKSATQSFFGQVIDSTKSFFAQIGGFFSGSSDNNQDFQLVDEIQTENQSNALPVSASSESSDKNNKEDNIVNSHILENVGINNNNGNNNSGNEVVQTQNSRQQQLAQIQAQLDLIKAQVEQLVQEANQLQVSQSQASQPQTSSQIVYSGSGGGAPVILSATPPAADESHQETSNQNSTSTQIGVNHLVISEIMAGAGQDRSDEEFVELYNPTDNAVSFLDWSLKRKTSQNATSTKNLVANFPTSTIAAKSFFLIAHKDYIDTITPDLIYSNNSNPLAYDDDAVILYNSVGEIVDEVYYQNIEAGKSWERKAAVDNQCATASSSGEFLGNGCDTDSVDDFSAEGGPASNWEIRQTPNPQNLQSFPEPRTSPTTPQNFQIIYNASAAEMKFNWQESQDYSGATSTLIYKIIDFDNVTSTYYLDSRNSVQTSTLQTALTNLTVFIDEIGRDYNFSVQAIDKEGLSSATTTATISIPGFLSNLYFYKDFRASNADYLIEAFYDQYPFIPDVYQNNTNTGWKAMVFYLNNEAAKEIYLDPGFSSWYPWPQETIDKILKIKYNTCAGGIGSLNYILILPDIKENCNNWGGLRNLSFNYSNEDKNFAIAAVSSTIGAVFTANDYLTIGYYSFYSSGWWKGLPEVFRLAAADKTKYYFQNSIPNYQSPQLNGSIAIDFDELNSKLNISWPKASDTDTVDSLITYEIQYGDLGEWQSAGNATGATKIISLGDEFSINIKAKDEFGNYSEIISTEWFYPVSPE